MIARILAGLGLAAAIVPVSCSGSSALTDAETDSLIREYYATSGEFAGTFEVLSVDCIRDADEADDDEVFDIDVSYHFCTPGDCSLPRAAGADVRRFSFAQDDGYDWQVVSMGAEGSGDCIELPEVDRPDDTRINAEVTRFYGTLGEFAGTFEILSVDCGAVDDRNGTFVVDSGYSFCAPDNCAAGASDGSDVREFDFVLVDGEWTAVLMGSAGSGQCL